jgi:hypothetical protein
MGHHSVIVFLKGDWTKVALTHPSHGVRPQRISDTPQSDVCPAQSRSDSANLRGSPWPMPDVLINVLIVLNTPEHWWIFFKGLTIYLLAIPLVVDCGMCLRNRGSGVRIPPAAPAFHPDHGLFRICPVRTQERRHCARVLSQSYSLHDCQRGNPPVRRAPCAWRSSLPTSRRIPRARH